MYVMYVRLYMSIAVAADPRLRTYLEPRADGRSGLAGRFLFNPETGRTDLREEGHA